MCLLYTKNTDMKWNVWKWLCTWSPGRWASCPNWLWTWTCYCAVWSQSRRWAAGSDPQPPNPRSGSSPQKATCPNCTDGSSGSHCSGSPVVDGADGRWEKLRWKMKCRKSKSWMSPSWTGIVNLINMLHFRSKLHYLYATEHKCRVIIEIQYYTNTKK